MTEETKKRRAGEYKNLNFGGTSDWAIDLQGEGTNANKGEVVYLDPTVWQKPQAYCSAPCVLVFPPSQLPSSTTINMGKYTTSVLYGSTTVTNSVTKLITTTTTTLTLTLPTVTTDKISYSNVNISRNAETSSLWVEVSVPIPPVTATLPDGSKGSTTRVLSLPAWPSITNGPPANNDPGNPNHPNNSSSWFSAPDPITMTAPPEETDPPVTTLPTWSTYPPYAVEPLENDDDDDEDHHHGGGGGVRIKTSCKIWVFNLCPGKSKIKSLRWILPPGIYPRGFPPLDIIGPPPPPGLGPGPKFTIKPPMLPWPRVTIHPGGTMEYEDEPPCGTESAEFCSTTITKSETLVGTSTSTITKKDSGCETMYGCHLTGVDATKTVTSTTCEPTDNPDTYEPQKPGCPAPAIVYPSDPKNVGNIPQILSAYKDAVPVKLGSEDWTAFYWIPYLGVDTMAKLRASSYVRFAYYYEEYNNNVGTSMDEDDVDEEWVDLDSDARGKEPDMDAMPHAKLAETVLDVDGDLDTDTDLFNDTIPQQTHRNEPRVNQFHIPRETEFWSPSQVSLPKDSVWGSPGSNSFDPANPNDEKYTYNYDIADASDTYVYVIHDEGVWTAHTEFLGRKFEYLNSGSNFGPKAEYKPNYRHGSGVAAQILGNKLGICPTCTVVMVTSTVPKNKKVPEWQVYPHEFLIAQLIDVLDDVRTKGRKGKATLNMSYSWPVGVVTAPFLLAFQSLLFKLDNEGVLLAASANNHALENTEGVEISRYLAKFSDPNDVYGGIVNMVVVSAADWKTQRAPFSQYSDYVTTFAPGNNIACPGDPFLEKDTPYRPCDGTSYATPQVAALANYFRSVPSKWESQLDKTANLKKFIQLFHRRFAVHGHPVNPTDRNPIIWNGQVGEHSCLRDWDSTEEWHKVCPNINDDLEKEPVNPGQPVTPCQRGQNGNPTKRQNGGSSCPLIPGNNGPGKNINWQQGPSQPECTAQDHCGGKVCEGYYCNPNPKVLHPPDYYDPKDPDNPHGPTKPEDIPKPIEPNPSNPPTDPNKPLGPMDPNNAECRQCGTDLGGSLCLPAYHSCLLNECWANSHCTACKFDCELLFIGGPDPTDPHSPECLECGDNLGSSNCPASDDECLVDQCLNDETCFYCKFDCNSLRG
ncbi:hypothetical protein P154DRAFT_567311 [Amniculicola lignicola CBS 123094]|uniref:Peptidase S8/S53 domain-containing protein n=1 Tax=Amniculicola lignicola CBS 123094 TaxID=1392246 RepID=A0A6A5VY31_9PLEO|nr:hypothetical protein P154DRAFT_567311 [Amniculicola lignicola CBS 123094]